MSDSITIHKVNESFIHLSFTDYGMRNELSARFTFEVPNARQMPDVKKKLWDGKIRLLTRENLLPLGLYPKVKEYCELYDVELIESSPVMDTPKDIESDVKKYLQYIETLNLPFKENKHQRFHFVDALLHSRRIAISPTGSGKSLIAYMLTRYYQSEQLREGNKILIIVPTVDLSSQLYGNFQDYAQKDDWDVDQNVHCITGGVSKETEKDIIISTWQSIYKQDEGYFKKFSHVIVDEVHLAKANSITTIMNNCVNASTRIGLTGTLSGSLCHEMALTGLFGKPVQNVKTKDLMQDGKLSPLKIKNIILKYDDVTRKQVSKMVYLDELNFILECSKRNKFIVDFAANLQGNTLVLFNYLDHGESLYKALQALTDKKVYYVSGRVNKKDREAILKEIKTSNDFIVVASSGVYSTGIDIPILDNLIFTTPTKSKIRTLQQIGRVIRTHKGKNKATLYDIVDDMVWKSKDNYAVVHFMERMNYYLAEKFDFSTVEVNFNLN